MKSFLGGLFNSSPIIGGLYIHEYKKIDATPIYPYVNEFAKEYMWYIIYDDDKNIHAVFGFKYNSSKPIILSFIKRNAWDDIMDSYIDGIIGSICHKNKVKVNTTVDIMIYAPEEFTGYVFPKKELKNLKVVNYKYR